MCCTTDAFAPFPAYALIENAGTPNTHCNTIPDRTSRHSSPRTTCIDDVRQSEASCCSPAGLIDDAMDLKCRNVRDCDEFLSCIEVMRLIESLEGDGEAARIDNLEKSLQRMRAMFADQLAQAALAHKSESARSHDAHQGPAARCIIAQEHDTVLWFDATAVAAAAASPAGRAGVKQAMKQSMRWQKKGCDL